MERTKAASPAPRVVAHVGLPRAASTFLQRRVLGELPGVAFFGRRRLPLTSLVEGDAEGLERLRRWREEPAGDRVRVVSYEGLAGRPDHGWRGQPDTLERVRSVIRPDAVVLVLRRQDTFVDSLYGLHLGRGYAHGLTRFANLTRSGGFGGRDERAGAPVNVDLRTLDWLALYERLVGVFGGDAVHVLAYEELAEDPQAFVARLASAIGVAPPGPERPTPDGTLNPSPAERSALLRRNRWRALGTRPWRIVRRRGRLVARDWLTARTTDRLQLSDAQRRELLGRLEAGNRAVARATGLPLQRYGYVG